jgi:hypothetical protein
MKKNIKSIGFISAAILLFSISPAVADPTYAVLDANGNVKNIIVCGEACASGTFGGDRVVLQVAADPVTNANRGGMWNGPGTTTYNDNSATFTVNRPITITQTEESVVLEDENEEPVTLTGTVFGSAYTFTYGDTLGTDWVINGFRDMSKIEKPGTLSQDTKAEISATTKSKTESASFNERKTAAEVSYSIALQNLSLLQKKVSRLLVLIDSWVKK